MADTSKVQFYLANEALEVVGKRAPSEKKRGEWVSKAIIEYDRIMSMIPSDDECGTLEQLAGRLGRVEQRLAALDGKIDILLAQQTA